MIRFVTALVTSALALIAAVVSYRHAFDIVSANGESGLNAALVPLTVDGMVFVSSLVMLDSARRGLAVPKLARWTLALGIAATVAANAATGWEHGIVGSIVSAWPAVALVMTYELAVGLIRRSATVGVTATVGDQGSATTSIEPPVEQPVFDWSAQVPEYAPEEIDDELKNRAASKFLPSLVVGEVPGVRVIKTTLSIGQDKAQSVRAYLETIAAA